MDSKRTPNNVKSTGAIAKSARTPRNARVPDPNRTVSTLNETFLGPRRDLNRTMHSNLNSTIKYSNTSRLYVGLLNTGGPDVEAEFDLAYNDYLQALMKRQIIKMKAVEIKNKICDHIRICQEHRLNAEIVHKDTCEKIGNIKAKTELIQLLDKMEADVTQLGAVLEKLSTFQELESFLVTLTDQSDLISVRNINLIGSQKEYDELMATLTNLSRILEIMTNSGRNFEEVHRLAECLKRFTDLHIYANKLAQKNHETKEKSAFKLLSGVSEMFAKQGGYE